MKTGKLFGIAMKVINQVSFWFWHCFRLFLTLLMQIVAIFSLYVVERVIAFTLLINWSAVMLFMYQRLSRL